MQIKRFLILVVLFWLVGSMPCAILHSSENKYTYYQITSGTYSMTGWIIKNLSLPYSSQSYVRLTTDALNSKAEMAILGADAKTPYYTFSNGVVSGSAIRFTECPKPPDMDLLPADKIDCVVSNQAGKLQFSFSISFIPDAFDLHYWIVTYTNVTAVAMPQMSVRISEVELSWFAESNCTYQLQYRSDQTTNQWVNWGVSRSGYGTNIFVTDPNGA